MSDMRQDIKFISWPIGYFSSNIRYAARHCVRTGNPAFISKNKIQYLV